jgi:hypothetical protein
MKIFQVKNHQILALLGIVLFSFSQLSCSSGSNSAKRIENQVPVAGGPQNDSDDVPEDGPYKSWKYEWESDVSDAKLKPCEAGKPFANGKCWDEVHFSSESISLKNPGESFTFLEAGKALTPFILEHYAFSGVDGADFILLNERIANINSKTGLWQQYWFLPMKIRVSKTGDFRDLSKSVFLAAEFSLVSSYSETRTDQFGFPELTFFKGSISLCSKILPLPVTVGAIESACNPVPGSSESYFIESPYGRASFSAEDLKTTLLERRATSFSIGNTNGLRG